VSQQHKVSAESVRHGCVTATKPHSSTPHRARLTEVNLSPGAARILGSRANPATRFT
jgi:hypothetical protein